MSAFERGTPGQITPLDLLAERERFTPANLANPEQIELIRLSCRYALKAASEDNSEFRVEPVESFRMLML
jgi:hypothetical protein